MNQFIKHQYDSKSVGDFENQQQPSSGEDYGFQHRKYSLPGGIEDQTRKIISQYIILRVIELGFNVGLANQILASIHPDEFVVDADHRILNMVIQSLMLIEQYAETSDQNQQKTIYHQFRQLVGSKNPNLMSYLGKNYNYRQNQVSQTESLMPQHCLICFSQLDQLEEQHSECEHTFCSDCFQEYCRQRIMNGQADQMTCPYDGCQTQISDNTIQQILGYEMHDKMIKFRKIKLLATNTDIKWCPRQECEEFVKVEGKKKKLKCVCGQLICRHCGREYHPDESCNQQLDKDFKKAIKELNIQKCPKCRSPIQKSDGCNHMTCKHCQYEFCWLCRSKFSSRHYSSMNIFGCPGMQFSYRDPFKYPNLYRFMFVLALIFLGPPLAAIGVVVGLIIAIFGLPAFGYMSCVPSDKFAEYGWCRKIIIIIFLTIACITLSPISFLLVCLGIVAGIIVGIPYAIYQFIEWLRD